MRAMIRPVIVKEMKDHFRDRRTLVTAAVLAVFAPLLMFFLFGEIGKANRSDQPIVLPVVHAERAPNLIRFLESHGATINTAPADYESKVRSGDLEVALVVPETYARDFESSKSAPV